MFDFGNNLKQIRISKKLTQQQVSKDCNIPYRSIQNYEENKSNPNYKIIIKLCKYFDISADYLLGLSDDPKRY